MNCRSLVISFVTFQAPVVGGGVVASYNFLQLCAPFVRGKSTSIGENM